MPWWGWLITAIWGPGVLFTAVMLGAVLMEKARRRLERRRPVTVDRRRPENAMLRAAAGPPGQRRTVLGHQRHAHLPHQGASEQPKVPSGSVSGSSGGHGAGLRNPASRLPAR